jgi:hypothetical protein
MKILMIVTCFCLASFTSFAQQVEAINPNSIVLIDDINSKLDLQIDLTQEVLKAKQKKGKQLIATVKTVKLYVEVQKGEVTRYLATDAKGDTLKITQTKTHPISMLCVEDSEEGTLCWRLDASLVPDSADN